MNIIIFPLKSTEMQKLYMILFSHEETRELLVAIEESPALNFASSAKRLRIRFSPPGPSSPTALPQAHHPQPPASPISPTKTPYCHLLVAKLCCALRSSLLLKWNLQIIKPQEENSENNKKQLCKVVPTCVQTACICVLHVQKWSLALQVYIDSHPPKRSFLELKICTTDIQHSPCLYQPHLNIFKVLPCTSEQSEQKILLASLSNMCCVMAG